MDEPLLVAKQVVRQRIILFQCLSETGNVTMTENAQAGTEKAHLYPITLDILSAQESDGCLSHGESFCHDYNVCRLLGYHGQARIRLTPDRSDPGLLRILRNHQRSCGTCQYVEVVDVVARANNNKKKTTTNQHHNPNTNQNKNTPLILL